LRGRRTRGEKPESWTRGEWDHESQVFAYATTPAIIRAGGGFEPRQHTSVGPSGYEPVRKSEQQKAPDTNL
jgi:hypothetical protein